MKSKRIKKYLPWVILALVAVFLAVLPAIARSRAYLEAGADVYHSERSYDLALITVFDGMESFKAYQTHPVHMPVKKRMHEVRISSVACDYVIPE